MKPGLDPALRGLGIRGDIIKTMHRAVSAADREPDIAGFSLRGDQAAEPVLGRLLERGLHDELKGTAYAIIEGVDGRTHHLVFSVLEMTGDAKPGATWLDRQLLAKETALSNGGFGAEVRDAMDRRIDHLVEEDLARRHGQRVVFARNLLSTLRQRELDATVASLSAETGLAHRPSAQGENVAGVYRHRVTLASGRFAMIDDRMGFQLVPWRPALEQRLGHEVSGVVALGGAVNWNFGRKRGIWNVIDPGAGLGGVRAFPGDGCRGGVRPKQAFQSLSAETSTNPRFHTEAARESLRLFLGADTELIGAIVRHGSWR